MGRGVHSGGAQQAPREGSLSPLSWLVTRLGGFLRRPSATGASSAWAPGSPRVLFRRRCRPQRATRTWSKSVATSSGSLGT